MAKTLHADLLAKQSTDIQPAIQCIFKNTAGTTIADYSFDPTVTTNRLISIVHREEQFDSLAVIELNNYDTTIPNLEGYYVDIGYGANTVSGLRYSSAPRLWVKKVNEISAPKYLKTVLELEDVWRVMREQKVRLGTAPYYRDDGGLLAGKTVYGVLEYLIETALTNQTGYTFTLDAIGDQDDGYVNTGNVWTQMDPNDAKTWYLNKNAPSIYDSFADVINRVLRYTYCYLRVEPAGAFKLVWPQATDAVNETYYSNQAHYFYENNNIRRIAVTEQGALLPNHVRSHCNYIEETKSYALTGNAYNSSEYSGTTYIGQYMPVILDIYDDEITTQAMADAFAAIELAKRQAEAVGGRVIVPHDARVEIYDNIQVNNARGF